MSLLGLAEGSLFADRYLVGPCVGKGGMGAVYRCSHTTLGRSFALKVMLPEVTANDEMYRRLRQEACVCANIRNEHIVDVLDAGIDRATGRPYFVMELLQGEDLDGWLKRAGRLTPDEVVVYLRQAAKGLDVLHRARVVHRDLKPGNIFIARQPDGGTCVKLLDFGIAKITSEHTEDNAATRCIGTPTYMAPEQFAAGHRVSFATDIYALGMVAFCLLVGVPYWHEETSRGAGVFDLAALIRLGIPEAASARALRRGVDLPAAFDAWFARATALSPADRYPTASAAIESLAAALAGREPQLVTLPLAADRTIKLEAPSAKLPETRTSGSVTGARESVSKPSQARAAAIAFVACGILVLGGFAGIGAFGHHNKSISLAAPSSLALWVAGAPLQFGAESEAVAREEQSRAEEEAKAPPSATPPVGASKMPDAKPRVYVSKAPTERAWPSLFKPQ